MPKEKETFILMYQNLLVSYIMDFGTMAAVLFGFWGTYKYANGSIILQILLSLVICALLIKWSQFKTRKGGTLTRMTEAEALKYLREKLKDKTS